MDWKIISTIVLIILLIVKEMDVNNRLKHLWIPILPLTATFAYIVFGKVFGILAITG